MLTVKLAESESIDPPRYWPEPVVNSPCIRNGRRSQLDNTRSTAVRRLAGVSIGWVRGSPHHPPTTETQKGTHNENRQHNERIARPDCTGPFLNAIVPFTQPTVVQAQSGTSEIRLSQIFNELRQISTGYCMNDKIC